MSSAPRHFWGRHYDAEHTSGVFRSLNPTKRVFVAQKACARPSDEDRDGKSPATPSDSSPNVAYIWRSRDNRKGRHALVVDRDLRKHDAKGPKPSNTWESTFQGILKMFVRYPVWDISYDVAFVFTIGSIIWVINGFFSWLPVQDPSTEFPGETTWGGGLTAFIGATVFEFGSVLLMLEAVNENRVDCFGWAVEESFDGVLHLHTDPRCRHSHCRKGTLVQGVSNPDGQNEEDSSDSAEGGRKWSWWPTWYELKTHYFREIGFLACFSQMVGATIFWIAGITSLPPILDNFSKAEENGVYWATQVIGGCGFIISGALFMIEVQPRWYIPAPGVLGWHIGLWNLIGAIGFTLCGALGFGISQPGVEYAVMLSTFLGSCAFLIGSVVQLFESLNKYPVWVDEKIGHLKAG
ncbi:hypothetical protein B0J13DRAFT_584004 [Dactylonectria estremocensis]|uniref:Integral membrane protein n=1 Tax=Dactylonectria estremocensis TaxID=1079267 RepID=A0A9P9F043_9HYPO|nr:hypothetical protein B0J13DRAFT_584004 [Dactylonectria estremocensis]